MRILAQLSLLWGVRAFYYDKYVSTDETIDDISSLAKAGGYVQPGDFTVNLAAMPMAEKGMVNTLRVSEIE
jgi:pyruvate kinase